MRLIILFSLVSLCSSFLYSQSYSLDLNIRVQQHDYRGTLKWDATSHWSEGMFGTNELSMNINKNILSNEKCKLSFGLGAFYQISKTYSAFNNDLVDPFKRLGSITRYGKIGTIIPVRFLYNYNSWLIGSEMISYLVLQRSFKNTRNSDFKELRVKVWSFDSEQADFNLMFGKKINRIHIFLSARVLKISKVDRYIFFKDFFETYDRRKDSQIYLSKIDFYNPLKLGLTINYGF